MTWQFFEVMVGWVLVVGVGVSAVEGAVDSGMMVGGVRGSWE